MSTRRCTCDRYRPGQPFNINLDCHPCWLFHNDQAYHTHWGGTDTVPVRTATTPSLLTKAASLAKITAGMAESFTKAVVGHAANGFRQTTPAEYAERMALCQACPAFTGSTCGKCKCKLNWKASMRTTGCPDNKWPSLPLVAPDSAAPQ